MPESMQPDRGGRFHLQLLETGDAQVRYRAELTTPEGHHQTEACVEVESGRVSWTAAAPASLQWLEKYATASLRAAHRSSASGPWPRRMTRWRSAPGSV